MPYSKYIEEVQALGERVQRARGATSNEFRTELCQLISDIPSAIESEARVLCENVVCPGTTDIVLHLQRDLDKHGENLETAIVFYPLLRVAIAIRASEMIAAK